MSLTGEGATNSQVLRLKRDNKVFSRIQHQNIVKKVAPKMVFAFKGNASVAAGLGETTNSSSTQIQEYLVPNNQLSPLAKFPVNLSNLKMSAGSENL